MHGGCQSNLAGIRAIAAVYLPGIAGGQFVTAIHRRRCYIDHGDRHPAARGRWRQPALPRTGNHVRHLAQSVEYDAFQRVAFGPQHHRSHLQGGAFTGMHNTDALHSFRKMHGCAN
jgi:hypothetical protein